MIFSAILILSLGCQFITILTGIFIEWIQAIFSLASKWWPYLVTLKMLSCELMWWQLLCCVPYQCVCLHVCVCVCVCMCVCVCVCVCWIIFVCICVLVSFLRIFWIGFTNNQVWKGVCVRVNCDKECLLQTTSDSLRKSSKTVTQKVWRKRPFLQLTYIQSDICDIIFFHLYVFFSMTLSKWLRKYSLLKDEINWI